MINRAALLLKGKQPFVDWIIKTDPEGSGKEIDLNTVNADKVVYLVDDETGEDPEGWVSQNFEHLMKNELFGWYIDEKVWPKILDIVLFDKWFEVECHSMIVDTVEGDIEEDGEDV